MTYFFFTFRDGNYQLVPHGWCSAGSIVFASSKIQSHPGPAFVFKKEAKNAYKMEFLRIKYSLKEHCFVQYERSKYRTLSDLNKLFVM